MKKLSIFIFLFTLTIGLLIGGRALAVDCTFDTSFYPCTRPDNGQECSDSRCVEDYLADEYDYDDGGAGGGNNGGSSAADSCGGTKDFKYILCILTEGVINPITGLVISLAFVYFLWGVGKYLKDPGDEKNIEEAKSVMLWGIVGMFVMFSVWGLVGLLTNTFELDNSKIPVPSMTMVDNGKA